LVSTQLVLGPTKSTVLSICFGDTIQIMELNKVGNEKIKLKSSEPKWGPPVEKHCSKIENVRQKLYYD